MIKGGHGHGTRITRGDVLKGQEADPVTRCDPDILSDKKHGLQSISRLRFSFCQLFQVGAHPEILRYLIFLMLRAGHNGKVSR